MLPEQVLAFGISTQEVATLLGRKVEVAVEFAITEKQVDQAPGRALFGCREDGRVQGTNAMTDYLFLIVRPTDVGTIERKINVLTLIAVALRVMRMSSYSKPSSKWPTRGAPRR